MKRIGKIKISDSFFKDELIIDLAPLFSKFIPIHIEHRFHHRDCVYTGYCADFDKVEDVIAIPYYTCTMKKDGDTIEISFNKEN